MRAISKDILDALELDKVSGTQATQQYREYFVCSMFQAPYMKFDHNPYGMVTEGVFHTRHLNKLRFRFISMLSDVEDSRESAFE